jgi:hypothetical protein
MIHQLVLADWLVGRWLGRLRQDPAEVVIVRAGLSQMPDCTEWLVGGDGVLATNDRTTPRLIVTAATDAVQLTSALAAAARHALTIGPTALLGLGVGGAAGHIAAAWRMGRQTGPFHMLTVIGPGLPRSVLLPGLTGLEQGVGRECQSVVPDELVTWSRTIGALGLAVWRRLSALSAAVVGCGRSGSLVAVALNRLGLAQIGLIDPDMIELHNLGEMDG